VKVFELQGGFGLDHLAVAERPVPVPGPNEVLVKMRAVSLNSRDLGVIGGFYYPDLKFPLIPVSDGVGEVAAVGEQVARFRTGDRVSGTFSQRWVSGEPTGEWLDGLLGAPLDGMLAEYAVLHEDGLVHVPEHLSDAEAACLPCAGVTAWHAVVTKGRIRAGDTVVVQGTGGVALFALQFAKLQGARVIVLSGSEEKRERVLKLGADHFISSKETPEWDEEVRRLTHGRGADHIVELIGAATLNRSVAACRFGGQISLIGLLSGHEVGNFQLVPAFQKGIRLQGINVGNRDMFEAMNRAIALHRLRPVIDREFLFAQSLDAFRYMEHGSPFGKVCIVF
jgi:NADPH:quinone reductase-like Zn-dependent oxidoreductase